jgi:MFS family permease
MWLLGIVIMIDQVDQNIVRGVITPLKADKALHITDFKIGLLLSCFVIINGLVTVPAGYLADRWHRSHTIGATIVGWSGLTALTAAAPNFLSLLGIRSLLGFGQAITEPSAASQIGDFYTAERRGLAFSVQQCLLFLGFGLGLGAGGLIGNAFGWRAAFLIVGTPGVVVAFFAYRLREPIRGEADKVAAGVEPVADPPVVLFDGGLRKFLKDMISGLRADAKTVLSITTLRYALVGVAALLFTITAVGAALPQFYENQLHVHKGTAEGVVGLLVVIAGIPGVLVGGRVADRYMNRVRGARVAIPAYCLFVGNALFVVSYLWVPFAGAFILELIGLFIICMAIPGLRAGLTDAVPHNLRGTGFGFFNLSSVIMGQGFASLIVFALAGAFNNNYRVSFLILSPPVFLGAWLLLRARNHLDADAAKIFQRIIEAVQEQQAEEAEQAQQAQQAD